MFYMQKTVSSTEFVYSNKPVLSIYILERIALLKPSFPGFK